MKEIGDFEKILGKIQVIEISQYLLSLLINTNNKVANHISKFELRAKIYMVVFKEEYKRVEKLSNFHSNTLNNSKINCYSNYDFSHLINSKLSKCALVSICTSK